MFSYKVNADLFLLGQFQKHSCSVKHNYTKKYVNRELTNRNYINSLLLDKNSDGNLLPLNYFSIKEHKIKDDINYKNSFLDRAYNVIPNATPIFFTNTLPSEYHPYIDKGKKLNPEFLGDLVLEDFETEDEIRDYFDKKIIEGYAKLHRFERNFYKQKIFRDNKLTKENRARITALEPHNSLVPHLHKLEIVNDDYLFKYIRTLINRHKIDSMGRAEIVLLDRAFYNIKNLLEDKIGIKRVSKDKYVLKDNPQLYFRIIFDKSEDEVRTISNYMTNYLETNTIVSNDSKTELKKSANIYNGWAYYLASLKDKFYPKDDGKEYKKVSRIRYSNLLISKEVYRSIFTEQIKNYLKYNDMYQKHNMYSKLTGLIMSEDIKIYRAYNLIDEVYYDTGEVISKPNKTKVIWYKVEIKSKDTGVYRSFMIDKCINKLYRLQADGTIKLQNVTERINLIEDDYYFDRYKFDTDREHILLDDEFMRIYEKYQK